MRWKTLLLLFTILLFLPLAAAEMSFTLTPVNNHINLVEEASFELKIINNDEITQTYKVYSLELGWMIDPLPKDRTFQLNPGESRTTTITVKPMESFNPGAYAPTLYIDEYVGENYQTYTESLKVYLSPEEPVDYLPSIRYALDMDEKISPGELIPIKLFLENKNPLDLKGLKIKIQSEIPEFVKELEVDLPPLDQKTIEFTVTTSRFQQPKDYIIFFVFEREGQAVKVIEKKIEIIPVLPAFAVDLQEEISFLKKVAKVTITNPGNVLNTQEALVPTSFWKSLITQSGTKTQKIEGQRYFVWELALSPDESQTFELVTNYRLLIYVLIAILLFTGFYFYARSPVLIKKKAVIIKGNEDGTLSEIKVTLEVRNKAKKPLKEISVIDLVPAIANVDKSLELGTLKPQEIRHSRKGTKAVWTLAELDGHEHRLITYKVRAKLNIVGTFSLPRATLKYSTVRGKRRKAYSNTFRIGA